MLKFFALSRFLKNFFCKIRKALKRLSLPISGTKMLAAQDVLKHNVFLMEMALITYGNGTDNNSRFAI